MKAFSNKSRIFAGLLCFLAGTLPLAGQNLTTHFVEEDLHAILATGGSSVVAADAKGNLLRSTDGGQSFAPVDVGNAAEPYLALGLAGTRVVAVGRNGVVRRSSDSGQTWTGGNAPAILGDLSGVAGNGAGTWVAVGSGDDTAAVLVSNDDGANWTALAPAAVPAEELFGVVWHAGSGRFVAVGSDGFFDGKAIVSTDGSTWTALALPAGTGALRFIASDGANGLLAGGDQGTLIHSTGSEIAFSAVAGTPVSERLTAGTAFAGASYDWVAGGAGGVLVTIAGGSASISAEPDPERNPVEGLANPSGVTVLVAGRYSGEAPVDPVQPAPSITQNPEDLTVYAGEDATFYVGVVGSNLDFQWQRSLDGGANWNTVSGPGGVTLTVANVTTAMNGHRYRVRVSNPSGTATSAAAVLTVKPRTAPSDAEFNDLVTGFEAAGYLFLPNGRYRRLNPAGQWVEGDWYYQRSETDGTRGTITFFDDEGNPHPRLRNLDLTFDGPTMANFQDEQTGAVGGFALDFDFFGLARSPGTTARESIWFGRFDDRNFDHEGSQAGWINHVEHGWLYAAGNGFGSGIWFWDHIQRDWLWTRNDLYPFFFSHGRQQWAYYERGGTPASRRFHFHDAGSGEWTEERVPPAQ